MSKMHSSSYATVKAIICILPACYYQQSVTAYNLPRQMQKISFSMSTQGVKNRQFYGMAILLTNISESLCTLSCQNNPEIKVITIRDKLDHAPKNDVFALIVFMQFKKVQYLVCSSKSSNNHTGVVYFIIFGILQFAYEGFYRITILISILCSCK